MTDRELLEKAALAAWLQWCLDNCDHSPEYNFGTEATKNMRDLLAGMPASMPDAQRCKGMMMEWMPIETAPKDGTHIIVAYAGREAFGTGRIWAEVVKWDNHYCGWSDDETEYVMSDSTFTHWTPLLPVVKHD